MVELLNEWGYALKELLDAQLQTGSFMAIFVVFAAGVLTSLTPCVYPMIPVTVTFIGGASGGNRRRAFTLSSVYVAGLALVYATLGILSAMLGLTFGQSWRSPWIYGGVGLVFVLFGLVMLNAITVPIPGFFGEVQTQGARKGGYVGALLMGVAAGFVAAPCTAPVLGALLFYISRTRDVVWGGTLMVAFSLGLGMLLLILGVFSGLLANLPRAGIWMEWIKKFFGFGMLAVAGYFLYHAIMMVVS